MARYDRTLDIHQGFNFKKDVRLPFGYLNTLNFTQGTITQDLTVNDPTVAATTTSGTTATETAGTYKVTGVLTNIAWDMGDTDPIELEGVLLISGKQAVQSLIYATMLDITLTFSFTTFEYDPLAKVYYVAFASSATAAGSTPVKGQVAKQGGNLLMEVEPDPDFTVQSPENYRFRLSIAPQPAAQLLYIAASNTRKTTKGWGRTATST